MEKAGYQSITKESNLRTVFGHIFALGRVSRAELSKRTGLSPTTVSALTEELLGNNFIQSLGAGTLPASGRRPLLFSVDPMGGILACVDLHRAGAFLSLYGLDLNLLEEDYIPLGDVRLLGESLEKGIMMLCQRQGIPGERILGICIGAPGVLDREKKRILRSTILPVDGENAFFPHLEMAFPGARVEMVNESSLSAYCEKEYGESTRGKNPLLYIDFHDGIGAGMVVDGKIYDGHSHAAGEFGHVSIDYNGPACQCGGRGCIEILAGHDVLARELSLPGRERRMVFVLAGEQYGKGDPKTVGVLEHMAEKLACALNSTVNLLDPEIVVLGGDIVLLGEGFLRMLKDKMAKVSLLPEGSPEIAYSSLEGNPVTRGGAKYLFDILFREGI
ncbi:MAG: ROK family protein [Clostridia bacterium]